jgi:hypothetical protein
MDTWKKWAIGVGLVGTSACCWITGIGTGIGTGILGYKLFSQSGQTNQASQTSQPGALDVARNVEKTDAAKMHEQNTIDSAVATAMARYPTPASPAEESQPSALDKARGMEQTEAANRAVYATQTAMAPKPTATPTAMVTQAPVVSYTSTAMPTSISGVVDGVDDVYNIIISGPKLKCCIDCNYGKLITKVNGITGKTGIPTYLKISDDSNTIKFKYGGGASEISQSEETIDTLLKLTSGYTQEIVTANGDGFRSAVSSSGHTLEEFASVLGGSYLENLRNAFQIDFVNDGTKGFVPQVNIYTPDAPENPVQYKIKTSGGKADMERYLQLLTIAGVPGN